MALGVVTNLKAPEAQHPADGALNDLSVAAQVVPIPNLAPVDAKLDAAAVKVMLAPQVVETSIRVDLLRSAAGLVEVASSGANGGWWPEAVQESAVVDVGRRSHCMLVRPANGYSCTWFLSKS